MSTVAATFDGSARTTTERILTPAIAIAAFASIGAGAIHAAAIGVHNEHDQAVLTFTIVAVLQIGWGAVALGTTGRLWAWLGAAMNAAFFGGWVLAKTSGISFVDGLDRAEDPQWADTTAAILAAIAVIGAVASVTFLRNARPTFGRTAIAITAVVAAIVTTPAMVSAGQHTHAGGHSDGEEAAGDGHSHGATDPESPEGHSHDAGAAAAGAAAAGNEDEHSHDAAVVPPKPYDPNLPIDLGGVEGVSPEEQARAENLIAITLAELPQFADYKYAESQGFRSIGDGFTGDEHFINRTNMADGKMLDPDYPESLVYKPNPDGTKTLTAAMFMAEPGVTLETVPNVGGKLTQWHIHNNLCFTVEGDVRGLTNPDGSCTAPLVKGNEAPMIHVWIVPHRCGPFAALEGVGGGQILEGETKLCDSAHGAQ